MDRTIRSTAASSEYVALGEGNELADDYTSRFLKLMPTEAVTIYLFVFQLASNVSNPSPPLEWLAFFLIMVVTGVYLRRSAKDNKMPVPQLVLSLTLYVLWAYTLGGPFRHTPGFEPVWGTVFLAIGVFAMPAIYRGPSAGATF